MCSEEFGAMKSARGKVPENELVVLSYTSKAVRPPIAAGFVESDGRDE
jgi:hypothetical protein